VQSVKNELRTISSLLRSVHRGIDIERLGEDREAYSPAADAVNKIDVKYPMSLYPDDRTEVVGRVVREPTRSC